MQIDLNHNKKSAARVREELRELTKGTKVGITASSFDLFHPGHMLMLKESTEHLQSLCGPKERPFLVVLLQSDPTLDRHDKNKPVQSLEERYIQIAGNRYVDYVALYDTEADLLELLTALQGIVHVRFIGTDWKDKEYTGKGLAFDIFWNNRSHGYSTTALRERVWKAEMQKRGLVMFGEGKRQYETKYFPGEIKKAA